MPAAFSMSPPDSVSAARQSSTPAPVLSRSSLTAAADTLMLCSLPPFVSLLMYNTAPLPAARCARPAGACAEGKPRAWRYREEDAGLPGIPRSPAVTRQLGRGWCVRARERVWLAPTRMWSLRLVRIMLHRGLLQRGLDPV